MNRTARALGMKNTNFKNAHGLTQKGHYSSARDMTILGRHMIYDYPQYYNLFSRRTTNANGTEVANTNRRLLNAYRGADGIKTGYTRAAGFNLVASAERGRERIIATMFGGTSGAARNKRVAELLDMGFQRAPSRVALRKPQLPRYTGALETGGNRAIDVATSPRPAPRPGSVIAATRRPAATDAQNRVASASTAGVLNQNAPESSADTPQQDVLDAQIASALLDAGRAALAPPDGVAVSRRSSPAISTPAWPAPTQRPARITYASAEPSQNTDTPKARASASASAGTVILSSVSGSGGRGWGIQVGTYPSRYEAERVLLKTALLEIETLNDALRQVVARNTGYEASFVGLSEQSASLACQRLTARSHDCTTIRP